MEISTELTEEQKNFKKNDKLICIIDYGEGDEEDLQLNVGDEVMFEKYLEGDNKQSIVWKTNASQPGAYPTAGLEKFTEKDTAGATSETIYPIVVEIPMEGGSLSWDEGEEEKKIENATEPKDTLLGQWDKYVETFISEI